MGIRKHLFIVEGSNAEPCLLKHLLEKYGFSVNLKSPIKVDKIENELTTDFSFETLDDGKEVVLICQGPRTRINHLIQMMNVCDCFENYFFSSEIPFSNVFLLYDIDHTSNENLCKMFERFNDQSTGLFVFDCPCIETISEPDRTEELIIKESFEEYKKELNKRRIAASTSTIQMIIDNFEELVIKFIDKNVFETKSENVIEHIEKLIPIINDKNTRTDTECLYRFFTTTIYVAIAILLGLTKEINNYLIVRYFFESHIKK